MIAPRLLLILRAGLTVAAIATSAATAAQQPPADREDVALAYSQCMRDNGYAEFPDPTADGNMRFLINPESAPRFKAAAAACRDLAPEGLRDQGITPADLDALLKLSQCVRENGLPDFPDPDSEGRIDPKGVGAGPDDPRLKAAMEACRDAAGGARIMIGG